jgi:hypothetical protein
MLSFKKVKGRCEGYTLALPLMSALRFGFGLGALAAPQALMIERRRASLPAAPFAQVERLAFRPGATALRRKTFWEREG